MKDYKHYTILLVLAGLTACTGDQPAQESTNRESKPEHTPPPCLFSYDPATTQVGWVAYKFSQKTGVNGRFMGINVNEWKEANTVRDVFANCSFEVHVPTLQTGDAGRDIKIMEKFFNTMKDSQVLTGKVKSFTGSDETGEAVFILRMNDQESEVNGTYSYKDGVFEIMADINVNSWGADKALASLNKECEALHKGTDGKSVLWPEVKVFINTRPEKRCP